MAAPEDARLRLPPPLPADAIAEILSRVGDAVAVVRCAATCKAWRRLILETSFVPRHLAGPSSLLGFFFRDTSQKLSRRRLYLRRPTRFLLLGPSMPSLHLSRFLPDAAGLSGFAPVALSGAGGLLALRRSPASSHDPVRICVCDPMAGTSTFLPTLPPAQFPESLVFLDDYASSFRLLAAMDHRPGTIVLRVFSDRTGRWGAAVTAHLPDNMVVLLSSPAVVHHGAVHWVCGTRALPNAVHALVVRPNNSQAEVSVCRVDLPLRADIHRLSHAAGAVRLSSSTQGCLSLILLDEPVISIWNFQEDGTGRKSWALHKTVYLMSMLPPAIFDDPWGLSIVALCDQSSSLFLHAVGEGLFVLNLETEMMSKVCNGHCPKYICPYVPDLSSCLGAMKHF